MTMRDIDRIAQTLVSTLDGERGFDGIANHILAFAEAAKLVSETMRRDPSFFEVWPQFVAVGEALITFEPVLAPDASEDERERAAACRRLVHDGRDLLTWLGGVRVPMPKSTREYIERCEQVAQRRRGAGEWREH
jgi:hypothetical protein